MTILEHWLELNKMNPAFQLGELCRIHGLKAVNANGIISFTEGDGSPLANYVVGRLFNFNLEEVPQPEPVVVKVVETKVEEPKVPTEKQDDSSKSDSTIKK